MLIAGRVDQMHVGCIRTHGRNLDVIHGFDVGAGVGRRFAVAGSRNGYDCRRYRRVALGRIRPAQVEIVVAVPAGAAGNVDRLRRIRCDVVDPERLGGACAGRAGAVLVGADLDGVSWPVREGRRS